MSIEPPSPILTLPNEILHHTLDFLSADTDQYVSWRDWHFVRGPFVEYRFNDKQYKVSQIIVLRSVCRRFRYITAKLDFWCSLHFEFVHLMPGDRWHFSHDPDREAQFLKLLLVDRNFANSLGRRKREWTFGCLEALQSVLEEVPLFKQNARIIQLSPNISDRDRPSQSNTSSVDTAIHMLAVCSHITTLSIRNVHRVNLTAIASSLPFLEKLSIASTYDFDGSLKELKCLRTLHMDYRKDYNDRIIQPWLPLQSHEILTELHINCRRWSNTSFFDLPSLDKFINLKRLKIGPLNPLICNFLLKARFQLDVFESPILPKLTPIDQVIDMFNAPCLQPLTEIDLSNWDESEDEEFYYDIPVKVELYYWSRALDAFTSLLPSVEQVRLDVPLHVEWCAYFARLKKLKSLHWDGSLYPTVGCGTMSEGTKVEKVEVEKALERAFERFLEKPVLCLFSEDD